MPARALVGGGLCGRIALALVGLDVEQDGLRAAAVADVLQDRHQVIEVVPVHRSDVVEAELLKEGAARHHAARVLVDLGVDL
jgi:hypothetical protein